MADTPTTLGGDVAFAELSLPKKLTLRVGMAALQLCALLLLFTLLLAWLDIIVRHFKGADFLDPNQLFLRLLAPLAITAVELLIPYIMLQWAVVHLWRSRARPINYFACLIAGIIGVYFFWSRAAFAAEAVRDGGLLADRWATAIHAYLLLLGLALTAGAFLGAAATAMCEQQTPATWAERIVNGVLLGVTGLLVYLSMNVPFWQSILFWTVFVIGLTIATWMGQIKLLGPVLFYDMVRTARRHRYFFIRMLYAGFLFFILAYMVLITWLTEQEFRVRQHAVIAETFFMVFMLVQLILVVVLTPAYVAGSIADEKDRKTIEFMLATDLRNREIVFSKLLSRLGNMSLLLITGLPILSILQFIGGVDPDLMLAGFAAIALTMLGIGSLSILLSTLFKRPRDAISLTYLVMISYGALATCGFALQVVSFWGMGIPIWFGDGAWTIGDVMRMLNAGNPIIAIFQLGQAIGGRGRGSLSTVLPGLLEQYAWFHLTVAAIAVTWSIVRLRTISLAQTTAGTTAKVRWWQRLRPAVSDSPMLWKEVFIEGQIKLNWLIWCAIAVLVFLTLGTGFWVLGYNIYEEFWQGVPRGRWGWRHQTFTEVVAEQMNVWWRITGTFVGTLLVLVAGVRAATTVTSERERDTFDALITTPMSAEGMLFAKIVGNLAGMKLGWIWFGAMLVLATLTGGIHPVGIPIVIAGVIVYATFMTMVGLAFSVYCHTSLQAAVCTVVTAIILGGGHWVVTMCFCAPLFGAIIAIINLRFQVPRPVERFFEEAALYVVKFQAGVTPPFVFPYCSFSWDQITRDDWFWRERHGWEFVAFSVLGLFLWWLAALIMWFFILVPKFRRIMRRIELDA